MTVACALFVAAAYVRAVDDSPDYLLNCVLDARLHALTARHTERAHDVVARLVRRFALDGTLVLPSADAMPDVHPLPRLRRRVSQRVG